jgi:hypothetical protein
VTTRSHGDGRTPMQEAKGIASRLVAAYLNVGQPYADHDCQKEEVDGRPTVECKRCDGIALALQRLADRLEREANR